MAQSRKFPGALLALLTVALTLSTPPAYAAIRPAEEIYEFGKWLGDWLLSLTSGEDFDRSLGHDFERRFLALQTGLQEQLRRGDGDAQRMQLELETVRSELAMLKTLMNERPSDVVLEGFRLKLASDLEKLNEAQAAQAMKHEEHETRFDQQDTRIAGLEQKIQELVTRLKVVEDGRESMESSPSRDYLPPQRRYERASEIDRSGTQPQREGITLVVTATGNSNDLRVREVVSIQDANMGTFDILESGNIIVFNLVSGTGAVFTLHGEANRVKLQKGLCGRVRVIDRGYRNSIEGCN